jgi:hypothetical protein
VLWVAFAISFLLTILVMFQSPDTEYLIHYGLFFFTMVPLSVFCQEPRQIVLKKRTPTYRFKKPAKCTRSNKKKPAKWISFGLSSIYRFRLKLLSNSKCSPTSYSVSITPQILTIGHIYLGIIVILFSKSL